MGLGFRVKGLGIYIYICIYTYMFTVTYKVSSAAFQLSSNELRSGVGHVAIGFRSSSHRSGVSS